jgi:hypothetical protein
MDVSDEPDGHPRRRLSQQDFDSALFATLQDGVCATADIARRLAYSRSRVCVRLIELEELNHVHRVGKEPGKADVWKHGPELGRDGTPLYPVEPLYPEMAPTPVYADFTPVNGRDPLVAALFGPAPLRA